jgi:hypothetical protein
MLRTRLLSQKKRDPIQIKEKKTLQFVIINNYNKDLLKRFLSALRHCDAVIDHHRTVLGYLNKEIGTKIMFKKSEPSFLSSSTPGFLSFAGPHHFNADPDTTFHINADGGGGGAGGGGAIG